MPKYINQSVTHIEILQQTTDQQLKKIKHEITRETFFKTNHACMSN